jgi:GntR family phosphonate transport system transcriptional regulator
MNGEVLDLAPLGDAPRGAMPIWHLIRMDLEHEIRAGLVGPGSRLPSEHVLAERYDVNRHTVRAAFARLAELGLVVARRGSGVFVAERPVEYTIDRGSRWSELEAKLSAEPSGRLVKEYRRKAVGRLAEVLAVPEGTELIVLESVRAATSRVATFGYHAFEAAKFEGIGANFARLQSFTEAIRAAGVERFYRRSTWIDCRMPRMIEAESLNVSHDQPVMIMSYVDADAAGVPILYGIAVLPSGSVTLRIDS